MESAVRRPRRKMNCWTFARERPTHKESGFRLDPARQTSATQSVHTNQSASVNHPRKKINICACTFMSAAATGGDEAAFRLRETYVYMYCSRTQTSTHAHVSSQAKEQKTNEVEESVLVDDRILKVELNRNLLLDCDGRLFHLLARLLCHH